MASMQEAVRRLRIESTTKGVTETTDKLKALQKAQQDVVVTSQQKERATQSMEKRLESIQRRYDASYRAQRDLAKVQRDLDTARAQGLITQSRQNELMALAASRYGQASVAVQGFGLSLTRTLGVLGIGLSVGAVAGFAQNAVKSLGEIAETAVRVGASTEALQALRFELRQSGGDAENAEQALVKFGDAAATAAFGENTLTKLFKDNGVALREKNGALRSAESLLEDYARLVANASTQQEKIALTTEAFGRRAGPKMIATLEEIASKGLPALIDKAREAGQIADSELIRKADEIDDAWTKMVDGVSLKLKTLVVETIRAGEALSGAMSRINKPSPMAGLMESAGLGLTDGGDLPNGQSATAAPKIDYGSMRDLDFTLGGISQPRGRSTNTSALGGRGTQKQDEYERQTQAIERQIEALRIQAATYGMTEEAAARYRVEQELLNAAKEAGITVSANDRQVIAATADAYSRAVAEIEALRQKQERLNELRDITRDVFGGFAQDMMRGATATEALTNALSRLGDRLMNLALDQALNAIFGAAGGRGGGGLFANLFHRGGVVGGAGEGRYVHPAYFDDAPRYHSGGIAGLAPDEVPAILQKGERVLPRSAQGSGSIAVNVSIDLSGANGDETIRRISAQAAAEGTRRALEQVPGIAISTFSNARATMPGRVRER